MRAQHPWTSRLKLTAARRSKGHTQDATIAALATRSQCLVRLSGLVRLSELLRMNEACEAL